MKIFKILIINLTLLFAFQVSSFAQSKSVAPIKIALISFEKFSDASTGIKDAITVNEKLEQEFKPHNQELRLLAEDYKKLQNEIVQISKIRELHASQFELVKKKINESESLICKIITKQDTARLLYDKREAFLREEVNIKIAESLKVFAKDKGYTVVLENSQNNIVIEGEAIDITNEFIRFYKSKTGQNN
jgi:Skp family chaperone for outer membrane proteins